MVHPYSGILFSPKKGRKESLASATTQMNPENVMLSEISQSEDILYDSTYVKHPK